MENSSLTLHQILTSPREKRQLFTTQSVVMLKPESKSEPATPPVIITPQPAPKTISINGEAYIQFPVGKTILQPAYMNNKIELEKIEKEISRLIRDQNVSLVSIQLTGYASTEASLTLNNHLSEGRTKTVKNYLVEKYNLNPAMIRISHIPEDWDRLRDLVQSSTLADKTKILNIIDSGVSEDTKEQKLRAMPDTWNTLLKEFFPQLRRVDFQILYITN
ncbi:MAG: OmpA family protein [Rikenellaceae bacterium]|nr:OmpA family protein [Rikenellaceae bacterium]